MKSTEILNKIKTFLTEDKVEETKEETKEETIEETQLETKVELAQAKLENGTVVESESFKEGDEIFIVTDDDREVSDEVPAEEKEMAEEDMAEDDEAAVDDWAGMEKRIKNLEDAIADIKGRLGEKEDYKKLEDEVKQQLSETPAAEPIIHSPEVKKKFNLKYAQNRQQNSLDRVLNKMYNN